MLTLHLVFIPRINQALTELMEAFNHHGGRTERNWTPYQMWVDGMMHADNPRKQGHLDENLDNIQPYGYDPDGPPIQEESDSVAVVEPVYVNTERDVYKHFVLERIDPL